MYEDLQHNGHEDRLGLIHSLFCGPEDQDKYAMASLAGLDHSCHLPLPRPGRHQSLAMLCCC